MAALALPGFADEELTVNPKAAAEAFDEGEALREEGKMQDAGKAYWRAIEADVNHYRAHVRYQESELDSGRPLDELVGEYDALVGDYPDIKLMRVHRARLMPPAKRLAALEGYLKTDRTSIDAQLEIGRAHLALKDPANGLKVLAKLLRTAPADRIDVQLLHAEALMASGKLDEAAKRMEAAVAANAQFWLGHLMLARIELQAGNYDDARKRAETVLAQRPSYVAAFLVRSQALVGLEKIPEALKVLEAAHRIASDAPSVLCALGDLTGRDGTEANLMKATPYYEKVLATNPEHVHALYGLAWVQERRKTFDKAEQNYRQVVALLPRSADAVNSVGYCLLKQGRVSEAQVQFKRALGIDDEFVTAMANLGATFDAQSKFTDAIKIYDQILKMKGEKENIRALINRAFDYEALTSFPKAAKDLERAHKILPDDSNICVWLGDNMYFQKKWKSAEKWYNTAIRLDEKSYFAWRGLGYALAQRKKWQDAINALEKAVELKAEEKDLLITIGDIYWGELEDVEKAKEAYEKYVARGGDDPDVLETLDDLRAEEEDK